MRCEHVVISQSGTGHHRQVCVLEVVRPLLRDTQGYRHSKVFHSFRHSFVDALRLAGVSSEINIALLGHTDPSVHEKYGAKDKAIRFRHRLAEAVASVSYTGLDLSSVAYRRAM